MPRIVDGEIVHDGDNKPGGGNNHNTPTNRSNAPTSGGNTCGTSSNSNSNAMSMNPLDRSAQVFWWFFSIPLLFMQSIFKPPNPRPGSDGSGVQVQRIRAPMGGGRG